MIERRPKILRLGDKSDPFMFAVNRRSRDYRKPTIFRKVVLLSYCCFCSSKWHLPLQAALGNYVESARKKCNITSEME